MNYVLELKDPSLEIIRSIVNVVFIMHIIAILILGQFMDMKVMKE